MTQKFLLVGDIHLRSDNLDVAEIFFQKLTKELTTRAYDGCIFMGDIFDIKGVVAVEVHNYFYRKVEELARITRISIIVGNHDMLGHGGSHIFEPLYSTMADGWENAPRVAGVNFEDTWQEDSVVFLPINYCATPQRFKEKLTDRLIAASGIRSDKPVVVLCHQDFAGFWRNGRNQQITTAEAISGTSTAFEGVDAVFSGHIHLRQSQTPHKDRPFLIEYVGVPFTHNFGEANEFCGVVVLHVCEGQLVIEDLDWSDIVPRYVSYEVGIYEDGRLNFDVVDFEHKALDFVRFVIAGPSEKCLLHNRNNLLESLRKMNVPIPKRLVIKYQFTDQIQRVQVQEAQLKSPSDLFETYTRQAYRGEKLDLVVSLGQKILERAANNART